MSEVPRWFDRRFEFSFPAELYPNLCIRLRGTPSRLEELMRGCSADARVRKLEGKWSAQEHAGHLLDLEPLWSARVEDFLRGGTELTTADLANRGTDEANYNARPLDQLLAEFRQKRFALVNHAGKIEGELFGRTLLHPRLKKTMRLVDHLYFVAEHDDHHLAKIWELIHRPSTAG